ncbi:MAG: 50S ribosomal protein L2 [Alphaproteobacteria bacterium]
MALKNYSPTTPSTRGHIAVDKSELYKGSSEKSLTLNVHRKKGRNAGTIATRHKGGGHKKKYRIIDFKRLVRGVFAGVERIEYDPNRTAYIALIKYESTGELAYIIAPDKLKAGDRVIADETTDIKVGNAMALKNIPVGTFIHNLELKVGGGGVLSRSAGSFAQVSGRDGDYILVKLRSGELRKIHGDCFATIGVVSNLDNSNKTIGKAGRSRWLGIRPTVRGVAMNPVDHPLGGGEGKTSGGRHPVSPWGQSAKGLKTRNKRRLSSRFIVKSRHKK